MRTESVRTIAPFWGGVKSAALTFHSTPQTVATDGHAVQDPTQRRALVLSLAGEQVQQLFFTLQDIGDEKNFNAAVKALNGYFKPKVNYAYERYCFKETVQLETETLDQFVMRLTL